MKDYVPMLAKSKVKELGVSDKLIDELLPEPVLARIAEELSVGADALLSDAPKPDKAKLSAEVQEILDSFEAEELPVAIEVLRALRDGLAKRRA